MSRMPWIDPTREMMLDLMIPEHLVDEYFAEGTTIERRNYILQQNCYAKAFNEAMEREFKRWE